MKGQQVLMSSASEEWATPQEFYDALNAEFDFTLDPCATEENHKCERYFTQEQDGLKMDWGGVPRVLQSTIRQEIKRLGCKVLSRGTQRQYVSCYADTGTDGYKVFSRLHTAPRGSPIYTRAVEIRGIGKRRTVPVNGCNLPCAGNVKKARQRKCFMFYHRTEKS